MSACKTLVAAILFLGMAGHALAQSMQDRGSMSDKKTDSMASMKSDSKDDASTKEYKAADMAMMNNMDVAYSGDADVDFRTHMIPHHKGAVAMARVALKYAKDPLTRHMAQKIVDDQETEISQMETWLKQHGR